MLSQLHGAILTDLAQLRLRPMQCCPDDHVIYCRGSEVLAVSKPEKRVTIPMDADTAVVSVDDYRRLTKEIADEEER